MRDLTVCRTACVAVLALAGFGTNVAAAEETAAPDESRSTAVALNYCRASFHRILRYPSKRILLEEQEWILNNLNLNGIADEEVVRLYTAVLLEISEVQIAERERQVIAETHKRVFRRQLAVSAFALSTQLATAQYQDAVRTGCNSWWDYRSMVWSKELDIWKVDKARILAVTDKSSLFLDTFWKLARKRNIPDRWLIRGEDLDRLDAALQEPNPEVRLRVLQRMEPFMECYPPYWYYVGRTQQALGLWDAAAATYERLAELGDGHFRRDEMLAAGLANRALILDLLGQPAAGETALRALSYATGAWEVNLLCARVLERFGYTAEAEDAILRNLDVDLEREQSLVALLSLYHRAEDRRQLAAWLAKPEVVASLPLPVLAECAATLGPESLPPHVRERFVGSLSADFDLRFGPDDVVVTLSLPWQVSSAQAVLLRDGRQYRQPALSMESSHAELRFGRVADVGSPLSPPGEPIPAALALHHAGMRPMILHLRSVGSLVQRTSAEEELLGLPLFSSSGIYRLAAIDVGDVRLALDPSMEVPKSPAVRPAAPVVPVPAVELMPPIIDTDEEGPLLVPPPPALTDELPPLGE